MIIAANLSRKWLEFNKPQEGFFAVNFSKNTKVNFMFIPSFNKLNVVYTFFYFLKLDLCRQTYTHLFYMYWGQIKTPSCYEKHNNSEQIY